MKQRTTVCMNHKVAIFVASFLKMLLGKYYNCVCSYQLLFQVDNQCYMAQFYAWCMSIHARFRSLPLWSECRGSFNSLVICYGTALTHFCYRSKKTGSKKIKIEAVFHEEKNAIVVSSTFSNPKFFLLFFVELCSVNYSRCMNH